MTGTRLPFSHGGGTLRRLDVEFESVGTTLRGWLVLPDGASVETPVPGVVMSSGFAGVKEGFLGNPFHDVMADAGIAVLLYDHANTGASDGSPRQELDPALQQQGYRDAISFLGAREEVDTDRIGIWGTSYSGGHVIVVGAEDDRVRCVVSQAMTISGHRNLLRRHGADRYEAMRREWEDERARVARGEAPRLVPAFGADSESVRYQAARPIAERERWRNEITVRSWELYDAYEPVASIASVAPTPLLMMVCLDDTMTPAEDALAAYELAGEPKRLVTVPGTHYAVYGEQFATVSTAARDWFVEHLQP
ncbi:MAG TPA: alpha/beta hydrolase [Acidimicrobiia bacterium]|nr:alpha/beta hydrolase [Acidimicrobiia bacterium]